MGKMTVSLRRCRHEKVMLEHKVERGLTFASHLFLYSMSFLVCSEKPDPKRAPLVPLPMPKKLYFRIDREIKRDIEHAKQNLDM